MQTKDILLCSRKIQDLILQVFFFTVRTFSFLFKKRQDDLIAFQLMINYFYMKRLKVSFIYHVADIRSFCEYFDLVQLILMRTFQALQ